MVFANARLIDGTGREPVERATVRIEDGRIAEIDELSATPPDDSIDLQGRTLMPGLIDAHAHLSSDISRSPGFGPPPSLHGELPRPRELGYFVLAKTARALLAAGITSIRDVGSYDDEAIVLREAVRLGLVEGPRILSCGRIISATAPGGAIFTTMYREANGPDDMRKAVREQLRRGADFIKLMATGARSVLAEDPEPAQMTTAELETIVDEAHRLGVRVAAHVEGLAGARLAVNAGVDTIEHGLSLHREPALLDAMAQADIVLVPTLSTFHDLAERFTDDFAPALVEQAKRQLEEAYLTLVAARTAGVTLAMGHDSGPPGDNAIELVRMVEGGLSPLEGISAATHGSARALGLPDVGTVSAGAVADLIVLDGDPVADVRVLCQPDRLWAVVQAGRIVAGRGRVPELAPGMTAEAVTAAPDFTLPSTSGAPLALADLHGDGAALLLFVSEECPTCTLTLRRLAPLLPALAASGLRVAAVFEDPLEVAARVARRTGFGGLVLAEPAPYEVSRAYSLESLPTAVLVDSAGRQTGRVVGWDSDALGALLSVPVTDEAPTRKPGCAAKNTYDPETLRALDGAGFDEFEEMFERGWTDGLPVIPPTRMRVDAMLGGHDPSEPLGEMAPAMAHVTLERVAACAVLAGCRPEYFPVLVAAVQAVLEPAFNVGGQAVTTQPVGQVVVVNGPVRDAIGLNGSVGALGPGWRANMTIGRALRLVISLTGGGFPGRLDRSALADPGKVGLCFAEDEEVSPWEPLHVSHGHDPGRSVVTVFGADAPLSISDHRSTGPEELARVLGEAAAATWSPTWWPLGGTSLFVLCPEHARSFAEWGWGKQQVRDAMFEAVRRPAASLRWGETTPLVLGAGDDQLIGKWSHPDDIVIVVAGGEAGRFSAVFGPCLGMDAQPISKEVPWIT